MSTVERFPETPEDGALSSDVVRSGQVVVTTVIPIGNDGELAGTSIEEQSELALRCLRSELERASSSLDHVLHLTIYLTHLKRDRSKFNEIYYRYFKGNLPVRCAVGVTELALEGMLVELTAIAAPRLGPRPDDGSGRQLRSDCGDDSRSNVREASSV